MRYSRSTADDDDSLPRSLRAAGLELRAPVDDDSALVADLMGGPEDAERPVEIVGGWQEHWAAHGYGTWIIRDGQGRSTGFVGLRAHAEFIRLTLRTDEHDGSEDLGRRALRLLVAYAVEWLPDLPLRLRAAPDDHGTRQLVEAAGMVHDPELDHEGHEGPWVVYELPYVRVAERIPPRAREALLATWLQVNDTGGSVGFLPGTPASDVEPVLDGYALRLERGDTVCVSLNSPLGDLLGFGFLVGARSSLMRHTATLERVMTDPTRRGSNLGALLMAGLHRAARERGVELVTLDYRDGTGLGEFYARHGYDEVGRVPGMIRVADGDDRDSVIMARSL